MQKYEEFSMQVEEINYKLKQGSRQWVLKFDQVIMSFGLVGNVVDKCLYARLVKVSYFLVFYFNDTLLASSAVCSLKEINCFVRRIEG